MLLLCGRDVLPGAACWPLASGGVAAPTVSAAGYWGILAGFSKVPFASALRHGNQPDPQQHQGPLRTFPDYSGVSLTTITRMIG